ncbi:bifunctional copper resistance protein CopD/cytochrome c oxidase assembly protein [Microbacterium sp. MPKO10]|uniref:bifunctional copper resistance protein CopD/cytochrome c oxidase assembly protein n=1 Tax=Microbacterium sp. MPKO10 TaxID=2989818 RepID=UPI002235A847|nr:bifunctional copper resistance protein CopD/cytochrome c oxidase assembly protein [Microbacterium sp. MPKO10]MCW4459093.1 bifunctional copper resistance protein CopD/cytochrome c oxidase assembly protein [Microbacterium sp. MPKO10]
MNRSLRILGPSVLLAMALLAVFAGLAIGGGASAPAIGDPGTVVRFGLPITKLLVNLSVGVTLGTLVIALFALDSTRPAYTRALDIAAGAAGVYTVASAATAFYTFMSITGTQFSFGNDFGQKLAVFFTDVEVGQAWLITTLIAASVTVLCFAVRNQTGLFFVGVLALASLIPMAEQGHAAGAANHAQAVNGLGLHLVFAAVWVGGLLALILLKRELGAVELTQVLSRYSSVALICFIVVAVSGYVSAQLRIGAWSELLTPYGLLVLLKIAALVALGLFGAMYRRWVINRMPQPGAAAQGVVSKAARSRTRLFWILAATEIGFMGLASGFAAALARTATPVPQEAPQEGTPAILLTGDPLPPPVQPSSFVTGWDIDLIWLLVCGFGIFFYLAGVYRLHKRGDKWSVLRTISWVAGLLLLFYFTSGATNLYQRYMFSLHMLGHMGLTMAVPALLVPGAPFTLALRALHKRTDGSRGPREWVLTFVHAKISTFLSHGVIAAILFAGSLWVFYFSPLLRWAMEEHIGHEWMIAHFLITGYLFVNALIGVDPGPPRLGYPMRLLLLMATMAMHAFFGITIMMSTGLFAADWFGAMGRTWGPTPLEDQYIGGGIAWSVGEIPTIVLAIIVAVQWAKSDTREQNRNDRSEERTDDAKLRAYNEQLAKLAARDDADKDKV